MPIPTVATEPGPRRQTSAPAGAASFEDAFEEELVQQFGDLGPGGNGVGRSAERWRRRRPGRSPPALSNRTRRRWAGPRDRPTGGGTPRVMDWSGSWPAGADDPHGPAAFGPDPGRPRRGNGGSPFRVHRVLGGYRLTRPVSPSSPARATSSSTSCSRAPTNGPHRPSWRPWTRSGATSTPSPRRSTPSFDIRLLAEDVDLGLDILSDIMWRPALRPRTSTPSVR